MEESPDDNNKQDKKIIAIVSIVLITIFLIALYNASGKIYSKIKNKKTYANYPEKTNHHPINKVTDEDKPAVEEEYTQSKIIKGKTKLGKSQNLRQQQK